MKLITLTFVLFSLSPLLAVIPEKILICGICKNVGKELPKTIKIIEEIGGLFEDYQVVIYENNSTDKTPSILKKWAKKKSFCPL